MPIDPLKGRTIPSGVRTARCPRGHINEADSWQLGNRCHYPGCGYVGDPVGATPSTRHSQNNRARNGIVLIALVIIGVVTFFLAKPPSPVRLSPQPALLPTSVYIWTNTPIVSVPLPTRAPIVQSTPLPSISVADAISTVERFYTIRENANRFLDDSLLTEVLIGDALLAQEKTIETLKEKNCYWIYGYRNLKTISVEGQGTPTIRLDIQVSEDAALYCNGTYDLGSYTRDTVYVVNYVLVQINGRFYITYRKRI